MSETNEIHNSEILFWDGFLDCVLCYMIYICLNNLYIFIQLLIPLNWSVQLFKYYNIIPIW